MIYPLVAGLLIGALATWFLQRTEIKYLRDELRVAHAQIAHAVMQDGAVIPPRFEEPEPIEPLPEKLQACVDQWDTADSRATEEAQIRNWLGQGRHVDSILRQYEANP